MTNSFMQYLKHVTPEASQLGGWVATFYKQEPSVCEGSFSFWRPGARRRGPGRNNLPHLATETVNLWKRGGFRCSTLTWPARNAENTVLSTRDCAARNARPPWSTTI